VKWLKWLMARIDSFDFMVKVLAFNVGLILLLFLAMKLL
tara:strand:+ start:10021 stop:10137 length:117 start_codon:yes stop_codon:yes gene_type:complete